MILKSISGKVLYECEAEDIGYCLRKASNHRVNLEGVDLRNLNLSGITISRLKMEYSDLTGANFSGACLIQANLYGYQLMYIDAAIDIHHSETDRCKWMKIHRSVFLSIGSFQRQI